MDKNIVTNIDNMKIADARKYIELGLALEGFIDMW